MSSLINACTETKNDQKIPEKEREEKKKKRAYRLSTASGTKEQNNLFRIAAHYEFLHVLQLILPVKKLISHCRIKLGRPVPIFRPNFKFGGGSGSDLGRLPECFNKVRIQGARQWGDSRTIGLRLSRNFV
jgi:hypothetical protein